VNNPKTIKIDEIEYVRKDSISKKADDLNDMENVMIRSFGAGVFVGYLAEKKHELNGVNVTMKKCRRIHYWDGACSLTQLAIDGTVAPSNCRITDPIDSQFIANVIEILPLSEKANKIISGVKSWKK